MAIEDYIARDNPARAVSFVDELIDLGDSLSNEGEAEKGTPAKWIRDTNVRELYYKNYTIVYEICGDDIIIHEVYNSAKIVSTTSRLVIIKILNDRNFKP